MAQKNIVGLADLRLLGTMLQPSWLSGLFCITTTFTIAVGTGLLTRARSDLQQSLLSLHGAYAHSSVNQTTSHITQVLASNQLINNVLLFLFWAVVGLVLYSFAQGLVHELRSGDELIHRLHYVNSNKKSILTDVVLRAAIRLGAVGVLAFLCHQLLYHTLPYVIAASHVATLHPAVTHNWFIGVGALLLAIVGLHAAVVLTRLLVLRPRLIHSQGLDE
ncbi:MAG TPA: hypothetical protein VGS08_00225 [Candidatus Saccharimonadales bacterium]|nr:hypothetical protein [Candidatus Saccharimonadales bacterium]